MTESTLLACAATVGSWVTTMIVLPSSVFSRRRISITRAAATASRLPVGSSATRSFGSLTIAREGRVETSQHPLPWGPDDDSALAMAAAFAAACRGERQPESTGWDAATRWLLEAFRLAGAEP